MLYLHLSSILSIRLLPSHWEYLMGRYSSDTPFIVALDFDGTIKSGKDYDLNWETWKPSPGFLRFVGWVRTQDIKLVLWTCRNMDLESDRTPVYCFLNKFNLLDVIAIDFKKGNKYEFRGKMFYFWGTGSLKQYADFYVDDLSVGCPMLPSGTPDWVKIQEIINGVIRTY